MRKNRRTGSGRRAADCRTQANADRACAGRIGNGVAIINDDEKHYRIDDAAEIFTVFQ